MIEILVFIDQPPGHPNHFDMAIEVTYHLEHFYWRPGDTVTLFGTNIGRELDMLEIVVTDILHSIPEDFTSDNNETQNIVVYATCTDAFEVTWWRYCWHKLIRAGRTVKINLWRAYKTLSNLWTDNLLERR